MAKKKKRIIPKGLKSYRAKIKKATRAVSKQIATAERRLSQLKRNKAIKVKVINRKLKKSSR